MQPTATPPVRGVLAAQQTQQGMAVITTVGRRPDAPWVV
jgi:hypothetical protein